MENQKEKPRLNLSLKTSKREKNQDGEAIEVADVTNQDGDLFDLDTQTKYLIRLTVNKVIACEKQIANTAKGIASIESHQAAGTFPPSLKPTSRKAFGTKEVVPSLQQEFDAYAESSAKADLDSIIKSKKAVLAQKKAELHLLFEGFKSKVESAVKNTKYDEYTSKEMIAKLKESIMNNSSAFFTSRHFSVSLHAQGHKVERQADRESSMDTDAPVTRGSLRQFLDSCMADKNRKSKRSPSRPKNNKAQRGRSLTRKPRSRSNSGQGRKMSTTPNRVRSVSFFSGENSKTSSQKVRTRKKNVNNSESCSQRIFSFWREIKKLQANNFKPKKFQSRQRDGPEEKQENWLSGRSRPRKPTSQLVKIGHLPIYDVERTLDYV